LQDGAGPTLIGQNFSGAADHITVGSTFSFLSTQMPDGSGGSLTHTQYQDIMAYILSKNGYPAGQTPLDYAEADVSKVPLISQVK
jgi:polar amino acid transport system substrate-binding protein